jgi:hypothetical protein
MRTIFVDRHLHDLCRRIDRLDPTASRRWGRMSAQQAVSHLNDSLRAVLGERTGPQYPGGVGRRVIRFIAFTLPLPWPRGVRTTPELDQLSGGTPPAEFEQDRSELKALLSRIAASSGRNLPVHHIWGAMPPGQVGRYAYRHVDHHLRQFGA